MVLAGTIPEFCLDGIMSKILITGGTGFIGSHLVEEFLKNNARVVCLVKETSNTEFLESLNVEMVIGDITDYNSIVAALNDVSFVVHAAGKSCDWGKLEDFVSANVSGTMNVIRACKTCGLDSLIVTGSISSYGEEDSRTVKNENSPYMSHYKYFGLFPSAMNYYRDTKAELTQKSIEFAEKNNMNLSIIEPAWVFGEREFNTGFYEYMKAVKNGMTFCPGSERNKFHVVYVKDLAKAYYEVYRQKISGINRVIIGERSASLQADIYRSFCKEAGFKAPALLPKWLVYPLGFFSELLFEIIGSNKPPLLTRARVNMMFDNIEFSTEKAKELLGFESETSMQTAIRDTVNWYKANGYI